MGEGLIIQIGKTAIMTIVVSRVVKSIGQKEIGEIIVCIGVLACGVYIIQGFIPLARGIQDFNNNIGSIMSTIGNGIKGFNSIIDKATFWR